MGRSAGQKSKTGVTITLWEGNKSLRALLEGVYKRVLETNRLVDQNIMLTT